MISHLSLVRSIVVAAALSTSAVAVADPIEVRMATLAPDGSAWMKVLTKSAAEVEQKTEQRVKLRYYAGGVQGDERDVVRKINLGQLDGAALTSVGLAMVDESIRVLELPRMFESVEELDYVADKMWPYFQKKFEAKGFRLEDRGEVGWIHLLSKDEIKSLDDLKGRKVWLWGDDAIVGAMYKALGVSGVPLGVPEVEPALTTGRINACYGSPLSAVALQWADKVRFMNALPMSFAIGGTVVKLDTVKKMSKEDQELLTKVARATSRTLRRSIRKDNETAQKQMERKGLTITPANAVMIAGFDKAAQVIWKELTGKLYSKAELAQVLKYREEYRAKK